MRETILRGDKTFDTAIDIPGEYFFGTPAEIEVFLKEDFAYSALLAEADVPARITINTNADATAYYTVWHYTDGSGTIQTDIITLREATPAEVEQYHTDQAAKAAWAEASTRDICTPAHASV